MSNHENQGTGYDSGAVGHETVGRADRPEPLSTGFERVYAEIHGEAVKPFTEAERCKFRGGNCFICGYNGANYFQPSIHACARRYHADEEVYAAAQEAAVERLQRELRILREQQKEDFDRALAAEASLAKAIAERDEARELITSFVLNEIDYMTRNKLGDAEQQHNVKWARRIGITATPARAILGDAP